MLARIAEGVLGPLVPELFFEQLIAKTENFSHVTWLGRPIWQNVFDLWVLQETICQVRPALFIETGTNRGGSALFIAHLFDLLGHGEIITIDIEKMHDIVHPRITFLLGSSTALEVSQQVRERAARAKGPVMVTLDSDHRAAHVRGELDAYAPLVTPGSYCLVQDGIIDVLPAFADGRPGPSVAIEEFLKATNDFEVDEERSRKFLLSHHPRGWLRRR